MADQLYKCEANGRISYQDKPCTNAKQNAACTDEAGHVNYQDKACDSYQKPSDYYGGAGAYSSSNSYQSTTNYSTGHSRGTPGTDVHVRSYTRKDGAYVESYTRSKRGSKR
jgi:hypothetical protein